MTELENGTDETYEPVSSTVYQNLKMTTRVQRGAENHVRNSSCSIQDMSSPDMMGAFLGCNGYQLYYGGQRYEPEIW